VAAKPRETMVEKKVPEETTPLLTQRLGNERSAGSNRKKGPKKKKGGGTPKTRM